MPKIQKVCWLCFWNNLRRFENNWVINSYIIPASETGYNSPLWTRTRPVEQGKTGKGPDKKRHEILEGERKWKRKTQR